MKRLSAGATALAALVVLVMCGVAACGPTPATSAKSPTDSPTTSQSSPSVTPNPRALEQNDCTAPAPSNGTKIHSPSLGATVTLPVGWAEKPADEGQQGMQAAFDLATGSPPDGANISGDLFPSTMSPHDTVNWMTAQPGAGTVVAKGDCTIAGGPAAFFESTFAATVFPGITKSGAGYSLVIAHGEKLVYLVILLPSDNGDLVMPQVKSILGSWQWDHA